MLRVLVFRRLVFLAVLIGATALAACSTTASYSSENIQPPDLDVDNTVADTVFPPTPTFPVVDAPILLADVKGLDKTLSSTSALLDPPPATATHTPTATTIPTPEVTASPVPSLTPEPSPTPCATPGQLVTGTFDSSLAGSTSYRVYLPPCYATSGSAYPSLYMLPGNIYTDSIWDELGLDEAAEAGIREGRYPPFIIVMVSGGSLANNSSGGPFSYESFLLEEFIPHIEHTYCAAPYGAARALGGMSRGGYWALEIAFRHPGVFASVGGHSAALLDYNGGPEINPSDTGLTNDLKGLRVYLDIGENDWVIDNVRLLHEEMDLAGREHTWVLNEGAHEEAYWEAHVSDYLDWYTAPWQDWQGKLPACTTIDPAKSS